MVVMAMTGRKHNLVIVDNVKLISCIVNYTSLCHLCCICSTHIW